MSVRWSMKHVTSQFSLLHSLSTPFLLQLIAVHGYYRTYGSGHSRLALRADFQV
jgi:hypothetical protein